MRDPVALRYVAFAVVCVLIGLATWPLGNLSYSLLAASALLAVGAILNFARAIREDKYSLSSLQRVHEKAELEELDVPSADHLDSVVCLCCGAAYSDRFPACPECSTRRPKR